MTVIEKLSELREMMKQNSIDLYIIPTDDFHASEYVGDYFKEREFMSGFTGSAGTLVVTDSSADLFTDGRYFLQAQSQLEGTSINLQKMFTPGVPDILTFIADSTPSGGKIGFDGRTISSSFAKRLNEKLSGKNISFVPNVDLVNGIWKDRPPMSARKVWILDEKYAGISACEKVSIIREKLEENHSDYLLISALDETAWTLNLRGDDVECTPVFLSFMLIGRDSAVLYCNRNIIDSEVGEYLENIGVEIKNYEDIYSDISLIPSEKTVWIDSQTANYRIKNCISAVIKEDESPVVLMKSKKTEAEINNFRLAHIKDAVAVTKFIYWLKQNAGKDGTTELSAAKKLEELRRSQPGFLQNSFTPIIAYGAHAAIIHYEPTSESDVPIEKRGLCLCDTGGHYIEGTTDITRTVSLGDLTDEEKQMFTIALKGHLNLSAAVFKKGVSGENLDILARLPLWESGVDFNHGTGHGVGYVLSVHEGPQYINWKIRDKASHYPLEKGMVVSNEPGFYQEGRFGIRHENLLAVAQKETTSYGDFLCFEELTMVPFDKCAIDFSLMSKTDIDRLNAYHKKVYENISPYFDGEELLWLKDAVSPV